MRRYLGWRTIQYRTTLSAVGEDEAMLILTTLLPQEMMDAVVISDGVVEVNLPECACACEASSDG